MPPLHRRTAVGGLTLGGLDGQPELLGGCAVRYM